MIQTIKFFAINCIYVLKEMTNPSDLSKSMCYFKEVLLIMILAVSGVIGILLSFDFSVKSLSYIFIWIFMVLGLWFIKNTRLYINKIIKNLISSHYTALVNQQKECLDATCCIPGKVEHYIWLLNLSKIGMSGIILWQILALFIDLSDMYYIPLVFAILTFAGFIHADKRLYEITKLINKNQDENQDTYISSVNNLIRLKFVFVSLSGFMGVLFITIFSLVFDSLTTNDTNQFIYSFSMLSLAFLIFVNQVSFRVLLLDTFDDKYNLHNN